MTMRKMGIYTRRIARSWVAEGTTGMFVVVLSCGHAERHSRNFKGRQEPVRIKRVTCDQCRLIGEGILSPRTSRIKGWRSEREVPPSIQGAA